MHNHGEKNMIQENFKGYLISANQIKMNSGKWAVSAIIESRNSKDTNSKTFFANDNIQYILEIEAAKESINLGKNLINSNLIGF